MYDSHTLNRRVSHIIFKHNEYFCSFPLAYVVLFIRKLSVLCGYHWRGCLGSLIKAEGFLVPHYSEVALSNWPGMSAFPQSCYLTQSRGIKWRLLAGAPPRVWCWITWKVEEGKRMPRVLLTLASEEVRGETFLVQQRVPGNYSWYFCFSALDITLDSADKKIYLSIILFHRKLALPRRALGSLLRVYFFISSHVLGLNQNPSSVTQKGGWGGGEGGAIARHWARNL